MRRWLLRTLRPTVICLVLFGLESLYAADLPRTRVEVLRPGTGAMLLTVDAELATAPETRTRGLMERSSLPPDQGMLSGASRPSMPLCLPADRRRVVPPTAHMVWPNSCWK